MREIPLEAVTAKVAELCLQISFGLSEEVAGALEQALATETDPRAREVLAALLENGRVSERQRLPLCQDTGMMVVFAELGEEACAAGDLGAAVNAGVARACREGCLRPSMLAHPLRRDSNTGANTPAIVHLSQTPGDRLVLHLAAKGGGSENQSSLWMLSPGQGREGIVQAVAERVKQAGGRPCPPLVLGIGLGGNFETAPLLAKRALLRRLGEPSEEAELAALEEEILEAVNATGVGPLGMGGRTTALAVHVLEHPCHLATLPVALNVQCHAARHAGGVI